MDKFIKDGWALEFAMQYFSSLGVDSSRGEENWPQDM